MADAKVKKIPIPPYACRSCGSKIRERHGRIWVDHLPECPLPAWIKETYPRLVKTIDNQRQADLDAHGKAVGLHHDRTAA